MTGEYTLSLEYLVKLINEKKEKEKKQQEIVNQKKPDLKMQTFQQKNGKI